MDGSLAYIWTDGWKFPYSSHKTYGENNIEELQQCLVYVSVELESIREAAKLQNKLNEAKVLRLQKLLEKVRKERDEAHRECEKLQECRSRLANTAAAQVCQRRPAQCERICFNEDGLVTAYQENARFTIVGENRQARHGDAFSPCFAGDEGSQLQFEGSEILCGEDGSLNLNGRQVEQLIQYVWNGDTPVDREWGKSRSTIHRGWNQLDPVRGTKNSDVSAIVSPMRPDILPTPSLASNVSSVTVAPEQPELLPIPSYPSLASSISVTLAPNPPDLFTTPSHPSLSSNVSVTVAPKQSDLLPSPSLPFSASNVSVTVSPKQSDLLPIPSHPSLVTSSSSHHLLLDATCGAWEDSLHGPSTTPSYQHTLKHTPLGSDALYYQPCRIPVNHTYQSFKDRLYQPQIPVNQMYLLDMLESTRSVAQIVLPEKGSLLQAVMQSGPLLQTLFLAGDVPEWNHPPHLNTKDVLKFIAILP